MTPRQAAVALLLPWAMWAHGAPPAQTPPPPNGADTDAADELSGTWLAPAEDANDVDALVSLTRHGDTWQGRIQTILETRPGQPWHDDSVCRACAGTAQGQRFKGLQVLWDLTSTAPHRWQGRTLDPSDGRIYACQLTLSADQHTLQVNAYIGLPLLGHKMSWVRRP